MGDQTRAAAAQPHGPTAARGDPVKPVTRGEEPTLGNGATGSCVSLASCSPVSSCRSGSHPTLAHQYPGAQQPTDREHRARREDRVPADQNLNLIETLGEDVGRLLCPVLRGVPHGNRVRTVSPSGITRYLVDTENNSGLSQVLEEKDGTNALRARFTLGNDLLAMQRGSEASFFQRDAHGSMRALTNSAGAVTDSYMFDGYGRTMAATGSTPNPYLYAGERFDAGQVQAMLCVGCFGCQNHFQRVEQLQIQ